MTITEQLRELVNESGDTRYAICQATELDQAALKRFADGGDAMGATLDKLAQYFGLKLTRVARKGRGRK